MWFASYLKVLLCRMVVWETFLSVCFCGILVFCISVFIIQYSLLYFHAMKDRYSTVFDQTHRLLATCDRFFLGVISNQMGALVHTFETLAGRLFILSATISNALLLSIIVL